MTDGFQPGLQLIHGNHVEDLADLLVAYLGKHPPRPLEPALFLVQSNGMAQWLKLRLARDDAWGIAAGLDMQMPARFVWQAYRTVLGSEAVPEQSPFDKNLLVWRLMRQLPAVSGAPGFEPLARFLRDDADLRKRHQLALQLADLLDQYQVYRADWLHAWAAGEDVLIDALGVRSPLPENQRWQAELWRRILTDLPEPERDLSRATVHYRFIDALQRGEKAIAGLPRRLVVFGISSLPQQVLEALDALASRVQVLVLVHNPCRYYWADIIEARQLLRSAPARHPAKAGLTGLEPPELLPQVNPLLASWGKQGRDYIAQLYCYDQASERSAQVDLFRDRAEGKDAPLLAQIQQGILDLAPAPQPPRFIVHADDSVTFQVAHSRQREVEILHDQLLDLFERSYAQNGRGQDGGSALQPRDVIVMVPDIDAYAPHIEAVFGNVGADDPRHIPYTIADRPARGADPLLLALDRLLRLPDARFAASEVLALLEVPAVRRRAAIGEDELPLLQRWVQQSGIRWGMDGDHRASFDLPSIEQNSWRFGLDRMLLGYAAGDSGAWHDIEPFSEPSGQSAALVGRVAMLLDQLDQQRRLLMQSHAPESWAQLLRTLLDDFFTADDPHEQLLLERCDDALEQWLTACKLAGLEQPLPLTVVREVLLATFDSDGLSQRFLAGCVNFGTLMPMRAIPFPVVCLLGMNDGDYPRQRPPADFDLMADSYRPGDRSRRDDDRYLFLEALLSARRQLYISYVGRDERDNSERTPSVLIAQLRDHIAAGWQSESRRSLLDAITVAHPLQPFNPRYFDASDSALYTYAREWLPTTLDDRRDELPVLPPSDEPITLDELARFLRYPADHFFSRRLGTRLALEFDVVDDDEPFWLDTLQRHQLKSALVDAGRAVADDDGAEAATERALLETAARLTGHGTLPPGAGGELELRKALQESRATLLEWQRAIARWPEEAEPLEIDLCLADGALTLQDWLGAIRSDGNRYALIECRPSQAFSGRGQLKYHYFTGLWVRYLAARACDHDIAAMLIATDGIHRLPPVTSDEARAVLERLSGAWQAGLQQPLPLALTTGFRWLELGEAASADEPKLREIYEGGYNSRGECVESAALTRCWPTLTLLVEAGLPMWAAALYGPLHEALQDREDEP